MVWLCHKDQRWSTSNDKIIGKCEPTWLKSGVARIYIVQLQKVNKIELFLREKDISIYIDLLWILECFCLEIAFVSNGYTKCGCCLFPANVKSRLKTRIDWRGREKINLNKQWKRNVGETTERRWDKLVDSFTVSSLMYFTNFLCNWLHSQSRDISFDRTGEVCSLGNSWIIGKSNIHRQGNRQDTEGRHGSGIRSSDSHFNYTFNHSIL